MCVCVCLVAGWVCERHLSLEGGLSDGTGNQSISAVV